MPVIFHQKTDYGIIHMNGTDVGMVQMYSKSANVNGLGFAWTGWPPSLHGQALLLVPMVFPPGGFAIPCRYTLHHPYICPCFWRKHFYAPLYIQTRHDLAPRLLASPLGSVIS